MVQIIFLHYFLRLEELPLRMSVQCNLELRTIMGHTEKINISPSLRFLLYMQAGWKKFWKVYLSSYSKSQCNNKTAICLYQNQFYRIKDVKWISWEVYFAVHSWSEASKMKQSELPDPRCCLVTQTFWLVESNWLLFNWILYWKLKKKLCRQCNEPFKLTLGSSIKRQRVIDPNVPSV